MAKPASEKDPTVEAPGADPVCSAMNKKVERERIKWEKTKGIRNSRK